MYPSLFERLFDDVTGPQWPFMTQGNYIPREGFKSLNPSVTVPSQALSIKDIQARFASGKPVPSLLDKLAYTGDEYFPVLESLDLVEREQLWDKVRERMKFLDDQLKLHNDALKSKTYEADLVKYKELSERLGKSMQPVTKDEGGTTKDAV